MVLQTFLGALGLWTGAEELERFAAKVVAQGAPLHNCVGFIDGTMRVTCRPSENQKSAYSGYKRAHGLKFQSIMLPNGIIGDLYGPVEGCRHDAAMLRESTLLHRLQQNFNRPDGTTYQLYGDPAYPVSPYLLAPFGGAARTEDQNAWNKKMSRVRQSVEWGFGNVVRKFAFLDYKKNLKIYLQPVGVYYVVGVLLVNCHNCLYSNIISQFFDCDPPVLEDYLIKP